jgi:hypothetical protein
MSKRTRSVTRRATRFVAAISLGASSLIIANACSSDSKSSAVVVGETGRLQLNLTGISNTDQVYRLRNGTFTISGRATGFVTDVNTELEPDQLSLLVELPPDTYDVFLQPGFFLERLPGGLSVAARRELGGRGEGQASKPRQRAALAADAGPGDPPDPPLPIDPVPAPVGQVVEAELISNNPGVVTIAPNVVSPLNFVFRVGNGTVQTGTGVLDIGLEILDDGAGVCVNDGFEPNEDINTAAPIAPGVQIGATLCLGDTDTYVFTAPVPAGETFAVTVGFSTALGDIDASLQSATTGEAVFAGGVVDNEVLVVTSDGGDYFLSTFLFNGTESGNSYTVDVGVLEFPEASNECCETSPLPGCNDAAVLECVCTTDPFCCQGQFDEFCVSEAFACGTQCVIPGAESDCCTASDAPGCTDPAVSACVCGTDIQCCFGSYDELCVSQAISECNLACTLPPPESDCCSASAVPGCTLEVVQECVCNIDPFCCAGGFDQNCAALAASECDAPCP